jgi:molybdenum cofactor biosynthesis protein B
VSHGADAPGQHRAYAPRSVGCLVLTVSDTRTPEDDTSGNAIAEKLAAAGHTVVERCIVRDDPEAIRAAVLRGVALPAVDVVIATGGTGASPRDSTPEVVQPLLEKTLHGFGELFRALSFQEIGAAAMLSRALAGTSGRTAIFVTPGSSGAVRLALDRLILPELAHLVGQLRRV